MELWAEPQTAFRLVRREMAAAQRIAVQLPRARHRAPVKNRTISRAQRSAATAGWVGWPRRLTCSRHARTTPARNHAGTTRLHQHHAQHTIRLSTTGIPHDGRSNHAGTTRTSTTTLAQPARTSETGARNQKRGADHAAPAAQRVGIQLPRARWPMPLKKPTISRAKRSAAMPGWAACRS